MASIVFSALQVQKTSIINCIAGLEKAKKSLAVIKNKTLVDTERNYFEKAHKRRIGYVFQIYAISHLNVRQNLMYGLNQIERNIFSYKITINLLSLSKLLSRSYNLSGGEKQRLLLESFIGRNRVNTYGYYYLLRSK